jgi:beta-N-acetylhexosaminidase
MFFSIYIDHCSKALHAPILIVHFLEKGDYMSLKEAPDQTEVREDNFEDISTIAVLETVPSTEKDQPVEQTVAPSTKNLASPSRSSPAPRKNLIPPRRNPAVNKPPQVMKRSSFSSDDSQLNEQPIAKETEVKGTEIQEHPERPSEHTKANVAIQDTQPLASEKMQTNTQPPQLDSKIVDHLPESINSQEKDERAMHSISVEATSVSDQTEEIDTQKLPSATKLSLLTELPTTPLPVAKPTPLEFKLTRSRAILLTFLLTIVIINATATSFSQVFGPQGWGSVFSSSDPNGNSNLLKQIGQQFHQRPTTPGATAQATSAPPTPLQIINAILSHMTLDEKLGQMLAVRFNGQSYVSDISAMVSQYKVGTVVDFQGNIATQSQITDLNAQIQQNAYLPMIVAVDQEGGTVDRLANLDGPQPSASTIGATGNPQNAYQQGIKDAQNLARYGFNLNLAPVVDVTNVYNLQLDGRTYGTDPTIVTKMAGAYLKGLQQNGKVLGTLKHFPGLGDTSTDPHSGLPYLTRSLQSLNAIDWAPYKSLLRQGNVYSIMVTHELVRALDPTIPSSLSSKVVDILRKQLGFQGVIITDGLTMDAILGRYTLGEAAALAVEAGDDLMMDPSSPQEVALMIDGIKQAMSSGAISQQRIDASVRRVLLLKYQMGLLHINA